MNTGNKLNKLKKKSASKPASNKSAGLKTMAPPKTMAASKTMAPPKTMTASKSSPKSATSPKKAPANKSVSKPKKASPKASQKKTNAPIEQLVKAPPKVPIQHTKKRYVDLKIIIDKLRANSNAANNFEDAYKIEGNGMTREEYKRRKP